MEPDGFGWATTMLQRIVIIDDVALNRRVLEEQAARIHARPAADLDALQKRPTGQATS